MCISLENELCTPNPCKHSGICNIIEPSSYSCDCNGTGYTGMKCEIGIITTPVYPSLTESIKEKFIFHAYPDFELILKVKSYTTGLSFEPNPILIFSPANTTAIISITGEIVGIYTISYEINGKSSLQFQQPEPDTIIVLPASPDPPEYFTSRGLVPGMLEPGSCAIAAPLDYTCPRDIDQISFSSTCRWHDNASPGIIFSEYNGLDLPVSIIGTRISNVTTADQSRIIPLMGNNFQQECNFPSVQPNCDFKPFDHVNEIGIFLMTEALSFTFLSQTEQLIPEWLTFLVDTNTPRTHDSASYMVDIVYSDYLSEIEECSSMFNAQDGMYSVLKYSGSLNFSVNSSMQKFTSRKSPVCFSINLCEGINSPLLITIPNEAQTILNLLPFTQIIRNYGWEFIINSVAISSAPFSHKLTGSNDDYWFGIQEANYVFPNSTIIADGKFDHSFILNTFHINFSLDGHAYMLYGDMDKVHI